MKERKADRTKLKIISNGNQFSSPSLSLNLVCLNEGEREKRTKRKMIAIGNHFPFCSLFTLYIIDTFVGGFVDVTYFQTILEYSLALGGSSFTVILEIPDNSISLSKVHRLMLTA